MRIAAVFVAMSVFMGAPVAAQSVPTLTVGKERKMTQGKLLSAESGDVACYLQLEDLDGEPFSEMAEFEVCEAADALIGRDLQLGYRLGSVMAQSCQGNPDCTDSDEVALVISLTPRGGNKTPPVAASGLCAPTETVVFSCSTGAKTASVCATGKNKLQYRFGKEGAVEMALPADGSYPNADVFGTNVPFAGGGGSWLRFKRGTYGYVVYSGIGRWGPDGETAEKNGVTVENKGKAIAQLKCVGKVQSELGPEWFDSAGMDSSRSDEFEFPD
jgi:hypothetical protein